MRMLNRGFESYILRESYHAVKKVALATSTSRSVLLCVCLTPLLVPGLRAHLQQLSKSRAGDALLEALSALSSLLVNGGFPPEAMRLLTAMPGVPLPKKNAVRFDP